MKSLKKIFRVLFLCLIISLALMGFPVMLPRREDQYDNEVKMEQVETKNSKIELTDVNELKS